MENLSCKILELELVLPSLMILKHHTLLIMTLVVAKKMPHIAPAQIQFWEKVGILLLEMWT
jgi:hypothetical protein